MAISEMAISFLIRCKGTTKNAHTQAKRAFFFIIKSYFTFIAPNHIRVYPASKP